MPIQAVEPIIEFLTILQEYGLGSDEAEEFKRRHAEVPRFSQRALGAERLVEYKKEILDELDSAEPPLR